MLPETYSNICSQMSLMTAPSRSLMLIPIENVFLHILTASFTIVKKRLVFYLFVHL